MDKDECKDCAFWVKNRSSIAERNQYGECRRYAPMHIHKIGEVGHTSSPATPKTYMYFWCGEFKEKE